MTEGQIPEQWIGELVRVGVSLAGTDTYIAALEAVKDRGIVLMQQRIYGEPVDVFYPWGVVSWIHAAGEQDAPYSEL